MKSIPPHRRGGQPRSSRASADLLSYASPEVEVVMLDQRTGGNQAEKQLIRRHTRRPPRKPLVVDTNMDHKASACQWPRQQGADSTTRPQQRR